MNMVWILLFLIDYFGWVLQQFDVKNVFLHGEIDKEIHIEVPLGFGGSLDKNKMCRLKKAWNNLLDHGLKDLQRLC